MRRTIRAFPLVAAVAAITLAACAGHGISLGTSNRPTDPALLLSCARSVASERGLGDITLASEKMELQAKSSVAAPASDRTNLPSYDLLTVKLSPGPRQGFRMLVGSASYVLRQLRGGSVGSSASRTEWVGSEPSTRVVLARDAVLQQCGSLGN